MSTHETSTITVRHAEPTDAAALHVVAGETFALACPPGTQQPDIDAFIAEHLSEEKFRLYLADPDRALLIAEVNGVVAGYTMLVFGEPQDPDVAKAITVRPTAELSKCYVLSTQHGHGVASHLIAQSVEMAHQRGAVAVWLGVNQQNERANRFYEKNGFTRVGEKRFLVGSEWHEDFVRERVL
ncbi:GNAT family N-acetyltransferase [Salinibacterium sp. ZJ454]|uniref:GNAT family N-acetyltransferase n=1 Tax=Salinibacterium sp. ZJ454 TaxID=2708339 RepID=UPI00141EB3B2|nr:GNAT family N-acetyltransferase [Salinibacterium sp. ZJ454]